MPAEQVRVVARDTEITPTTWARSARARYSTWAMRRARRRGCAQQDRRVAARSWRTGRQQHAGVRSGSSKNTHKAGNIVGIGSYKPDYVAPTTKPACRRKSRCSGWWQPSEPKSRSTPKLDVCASKIVNAVDCGTLVNPRIVETQISGAALMQLGFTMFEKINIHQDSHQCIAADYRIPGIADLPPMINEAIDAYQHNAPFGAKGVGESSPCRCRRPSPMHSTTPVACG